MHYSYMHLDWIMCTFTLHFSLHLLTSFQILGLFIHIRLVQCCYRDSGLITLDYTVLRAPQTSTPITYCNSAYSWLLNWNDIETDLSGHLGEPGLAGSPLVLFLCMFQERTAGDKVFTGRIALSVRLSAELTLTEHWREFRTLDSNQGRLYTVTDLILSSSTVKLLRKRAFMLDLQCQYPGAL